MCSEQIAFWVESGGLDGPSVCGRSIRFLSHRLRSCAGPFRRRPVVHSAACENRTRQTNTDFGGVILSGPQVLPRGVKSGSVQRPRSVLDGFQAPFLLRGPVACSFKSCSHRSDRVTPAEPTALRVRAAQTESRNGLSADVLGSFPPAMAHRPLLKVRPCCSDGAARY